MFDNLKNFLQGDSWVPLSAITVFLLLRYWNKGDWMKFFREYNCLCSYHRHYSRTKNCALYLGDLLRLFLGWDTGL